jgi:small nuclear ribonucleoprotein
MEIKQYKEPPKPLDALNRARDKGKRVMVDLKNQKQLTGILKAFDVHINCELEDVEEKVNGELTRKLGTVFVRGDTIVSISTE